MKKIFLLLVGAALLVCFFSAQAVAAEKAYLTCYSYGIEKHDASAGSRAFFDMVKERYKGQFDYKMYYAGSIVKTPLAMDALSAGSIDAVTASAVYYSGKIPIGDIVNMPFVFKSVEALIDFWQKPEVREILDRYYLKAANAKTLAFIPLGKTEFFGKGKPVETVADFKGRKMRTPGGVQDEMALALGASPVMLSSSETYLALQRGVVDSAGHASWAIGKLKLHEVCDWMIMDPPYTHYGVPMWINKDKWDSFPEELQNIFIETEPEFEKKLIGKVDQLVQEGINSGKEHGMKFIIFSPEEKQKVLERMKPLWDKWAEKTGADGKRLLQLAGGK